MPALPALTRIASALAAGGKVVVRTP